MKNRFSEEIEAGEEKAVVMLERKRLFKELNKRVGYGAAVYRVGENHQVVDIDRKFNRFFEEPGLRHIFSRELKCIEAAAALGQQVKTDKAGLVSEDMVSLSIDLIRRKISDIIGQNSMLRLLFTEHIVSRKIIGSIRSEVVSNLTDLFERFPGAANNMEPETALAVAYAYENSLREYADMVMPEVKDQFLKVKSRFLENANTELLPISREHMEKTLGEVVITVSDVFCWYIDRVAGEYKCGTAEICVQMDETAEKMEMIFTHESLHALSGKTFLVDRKGRSGDIDRLGFLSGMTEYKYNRGRSRFGWMNEGFTETLCKELIGKDFHNYVWERALVDRLFEGIPDKGILTRAYFENYDETKKRTGQERGCWQQVLAYLTKRFGQYFLFDLDDYILYQGLKGAETVEREWNEMGEKFPEYVSSFIRSPDVYFYLKLLRNLRDPDGLPVKKNRYALTSGHGRRA